MTPEWLEFAKVFFGFASTVILAYLSWLGIKQAKQVEQVRTVLKESTTNTDNKLNAIHTLANGAFTAQLSIAAVALRRLADTTGHPDDAKAAELAEKALSEHKATNEQAATGEPVA